MRKPRIRFQLAAYSPLSLHAILRGAVASFGDPRGELSDYLRRRYAADAVALLGSGTEALQLAIAIAGKIQGETTPIAVPAFSCYDMATAAVAAAPSVILYDVDPATLAPDAASLERVMQAGARIVVVAPLYGMPVPWDDITAAARRHGALVVEDAAQGHGASYHGKPLGSLGTLSILSFGRGKGWTGGGGGALLVRGEAKDVVASFPPANTVRELKVVTGLLAQWALGRPSVYGIPRSVPALRLGETVYRTPDREHGMTRVSASAIMANREASDTEAARRKETAAFLASLIRVSRHVHLISPEPGGEAGYIRFPVRLAGGMQGISRMERASALGVAPSYPSVLSDVRDLMPLMQPVETSWPGAATLARDLITLPTHSLMREPELREIIALLP